MLSMLIFSGRSWVCGISPNPTSAAWMAAGFRCGAYMGGHTSILGWAGKQTQNLPRGPPPLFHPAMRPPAKPLCVNSALLRRAVGDAVVRACAEEGTHYFDLSVETDLHREACIPSFFLTFCAILCGLPGTPAHACAQLGSLPFGGRTLHTLWA